MKGPRLLYSNLLNKAFICGSGVARKFFNYHDWLGQFWRNSVTLSNLLFLFIFPMLKGNDCFSWEIWKHEYQSIPGMQRNASDSCFSFCLELLSRNLAKWFPLMMFFQLGWKPPTRTVIVLSWSMSSDQTDDAETLSFVTGGCTLFVLSLFKEYRMPSMRFTKCLPFKIVSSRILKVFMIYDVNQTLISYHWWVFVAAWRLHSSNWFLLRRWLVPNGLPILELFVAAIRMSRDTFQEKGGCVESNLFCMFVVPEGVYLSYVYLLGQAIEVWRILRGINRLARIQL